MQKEEVYASTVRRGKENRHDDEKTTPRSLTRGNRVVAISTETKSPRLYCKVKRMHYRIYIKLQRRGIWKKTHNVLASIYILNLQKGQIANKLTKIFLEDALSS